MKKSLNIKMFASVLMTLFVFAGTSLGMFASNNVFADSDGANVTSDITIDGLYDDWSSVPSQEITYTGYNGQSVHVAQLYTDGEYLFVHFKVSEYYTSTVPLGSFYININGTSQELHIFDTNGGYYSCQAPSNPGEYTNYSVGIRGSGTSWQPQTLSSDVVLTVYNSPYQITADSKGSEFEMRMPLNSIADCFGINAEDIDVITISNTSLGSAGVSIAGTPTGPIIGVIIAVFMVALGAVIAYRMKKKKEVAVASDSATPEVEE